MAAHHPRLDAVSDKAKKTSLSLRPSLQARVGPHVEQHYDNNFSGYVQKLIERDLAGLPPPGEYDEDILFHLAKVYSGHSSHPLACQMSAAQVNQPDLLARIIDELREYLACGHDAGALKCAPASHVAFAALPDCFRKPEDQLTDADVAELEAHTRAIVKRHLEKKSHSAYPLRNDDQALAAETAVKKRKAG